MILNFSNLLMSEFYASVKHWNTPLTMLKISYIANQSLGP